MVLVFGTPLIVGVVVVSIRSSEKQNEQSDSKRALLLEQEHEVCKGRISLMRHDRSLGGSSTEREIRESESRMIEVEPEYNALIAKYPNWGKSILRP